MKTKLPLVLDHKKYALFEYDHYLVDGRLFNGTKKTTYKRGEVVYIKGENALGVVLGCIDEGCQELRTDMSGMVCYDNLESFDPEKHLRVHATPKLTKELAAMGIMLLPVNQKPFIIGMEDEDGNSTSEVALITSQPTTRVYVRVGNKDIRIDQKKDGSGVTIIVTDSETCMEEHGKLDIYY